MPRAGQIQTVDFTEQFVIVGLGAIGTLLAAHLAREHVCHALVAAGQEAGVRPQARSASRCLRRDTSSIAVELPIIAALSELPRELPANTVTTRTLWVLLTCKAAVARQCLPSLIDGLKRFTQGDDRYEARLVVMQNGLQTHTLARTAFAAAFGAAAESRVRLLAASTTEAARREAGEPDVVHHSAVGETSIGMLDESPGSSDIEPARRLSVLMNRRGLLARPVAGIEAILWNKLALNAIINPLTALLQCRNGDLLEQAAFQQRAPQIAQEVLTAWQHWGRGTSETNIPGDVVELMSRVTTICRQTAANKSSMLQDVLAGRATEIDAINGYLVDYCERNDLRCDANRQLVSDVLAIRA